MNTTLIGILLIVGLVALYIASSIFSVNWKSDSGGLDSIGGERGNNYVDQQLNLKELRGAGNFKKKDTDEYGDEMTVSAEDEEN